MEPWGGHGVGGEAKYRGKWGIFGENWVPFGFEAPVCCFKWLFECPLWFYT